MTAKTITFEREAPLALGVLLYATAFALPFMVTHPQLAVGSAVNAMLFLAAARLPNKYLIPLAVLPSIAAVLRGVVFGPYTPFLTFFLPLIWLGNLALVLVFRKFVDLPELARVIAAAALKAALLFAAATVYVNLNLVPAMFSEAMGLIQLETALLGGLAALGIMKAIKA